MSWTERVALIKETRYHRKFYSENLKSPLRRPRHRWEDNIRMDLRESSMGSCGLDSSGSSYEPVAGCCGQAMNSRVV